MLDKLGSERFFDILESLVQDLINLNIWKIYSENIACIIECI